MRKLNRERPPILAWMQPGGSKKRQILSAVLVPHQTDPGTPRPAHMIRMNLACTLANLIHKAREEDQHEEIHDLITRLESMGLLLEEVDPEMPPMQMAEEILSMGSEVMTYLGPTSKVEKLEEIPGARELLDELTLSEWLNALEMTVEHGS